MWLDPSDIAVPGFTSGDVRFAASAPLRSSDGLEVGLLVIADTQPRPEFSPRDLETLADLAGVLAGKMELRMMLSQVRETELSLKEAERRFRNIANAAPVLIIYSGLDGANSFVNKAWLEFTGRTLGDELGGGFAEMFHPDYRDAAMQKYWDAFEARVPLKHEFPMRRHDGEYRWMLASGVPRFQDDGTFAGYIGCFIDSTDQRPSVSAPGKQPSDQGQH
jgi:PAS domain S-box-containing protein